MNGLAKLVLAVLVLALLGGCARSSRAPVIERSPEAARPAPAPAPVVQSAPTAPPSQPGGSYTVRRGDTLYSIALDNGLDYRELAAWNNISDPNLIRENQVLSLRAPSTDVQVKPVGPAGTVQVRPLGSPEPVKPPVSSTPPAADMLVTEPKAVKLPYSEENLALLSKPRPGPSVAAVDPKAQPATAPASPPAAAKAEPPRQPAEQEPDALEWAWPASGKVLAGFSDPVNKGLDISGRRGEPVHASAGGRVVYIGEGLRGYGKLVIIKHNDTYLSAYAHNDAILVKEGQSVVRGQKIAEIGSTGTDQTKLHFEIRRLGKPVDPLKFLPERKS